MSKKVLNFIDLSGIRLAFKMKWMSRCLLFFLLFVFQVKGQDTLRYDTFIEMVFSNHPVVEKAELLERVSNAQKMNAKSLLDPYIKLGFERKEFDDKLYYDSERIKLVVPTKFGLNFEGDYHNNLGEFLNNREFIPESGLLSIGISMPILRGLLFDERRQALENAKLLELLNENQRRLIINQVLGDAANAYLKWQISHDKMKVAYEGYDLARLRADMILTSFESGELAAIDTLEAGVNKKSREQEWKKATLDFEKAKIKLSSYLWDESGNGGWINDEVYPEKISNEFLDEVINNEFLDLNKLADNHPKIQNLELKIDQLHLKKRLAQENQKPQLDLRLKPHTSQIGNNEFYNFNSEDYTIGLDFSFPIFNREYRAKTKLFSAEIDQQDLQKDNDQVMLLNKFLQMKKNEDYLGQQLELLKDNNRALKRLLIAEQTKFNIGESSLFLVNSREAKLLESQKKELDVKLEFYENRIDFYFNSFL